MSSRSRYWRHVQPQVTPQTGVMVCASGRQGCRLASKTRPDQPPKGTKGSAQPTQNAARRSATAGLFVSAPIRQSAKSNPQFTNPHQPGITSSPHDSDAPGCLFSRSTVAAPRSLPAHTLQNICCPRGLTHSRLTELAPCCAAPLTWLFSVRDFDPSSKWLGLGRQTPNRSRTKRKLLELGPSDCCAPRRLLQTLNLSWGQRPTFCVQLSVVCCIRPASGRCSHRDPTCLTFAKAHIQDYRQHQLATLDICTRHCAMGVSKTPLIGLLTSWKAAA
jgi:hypothetical protein